jgi:hypothetical protein
LKKIDEAIEADRRSQTSCRVHIAAPQEAVPQPPVPDPPVKALTQQEIERNIWELEQAQREMFQIPQDRPIPPPPPRVPSGIPKERPQFLLQPVQVAPPPKPQQTKKSSNKISRPGACFAALRQAEDAGNPEEGLLAQTPYSDLRQPIAPDFPAAGEILRSTRYHPDWKPDGNFDGCWNASTTVCAIEGSTVLWSDGSTWAFVKESARTFRLQINGEVLSATLFGPDILSWSDGDVWYRFIDSVDCGLDFSAVSASGAKTTSSTVKQEPPARKKVNVGRFGLLCDESDSEEQALDRTM